MISKTETKQITDEKEYTWIETVFTPRDVKIRFNVSTNGVDDIRVVTITGDDFYALWESTKMSVKGFYELFNQVFNEGLVLPETTEDEIKKPEIEEVKPK